MKILALRGENLASLPEFEIDFALPPLGETNIFAITGPTGAGKSTLLDALCLALYDRVPRLLGERHAAAEDERAGDPRAVMRRGTAVAFAEVDFSGVDGLLYRARWEVWRARRKPDGKLQDQRLTLERMDAAGPVSLTEARRTDTLRLISERVGLGFDEFRRAVLLAQGDFAAFLKATPDARASLLERMTGSALYARLSVAAFERAKREAHHLAALEAQVSAVAVWAPDRRLAAEKELEAGQARLRTAEMERDQAVSARAWHRSEAALREERDDAEAALRIIEAEAQSALPILQTRIERAERLRATAPFVRERDDAIRAAERAQADLEVAVSLQETAHRNAETARSAVRQAETASADALRREESLRVPLENARRLDRSIAEAAGPLQAAEDEVTRAAAEAELAARAARAQAELIDREESAEAENASWWANHPFLRDALAPPSMEAELNALTEGLAAHGQAEQELTEARAREQAHLQKSADLEAVRSEAEVAWAAAERGLAAAEEAHAQIARPPTSESESDPRLALEPHAAALRRTRALVDDYARRARRQRQLRVQGERAAARARAQEAELETILREEQEAENAVLLAARRSLLPDTPCPVCGSRDHPLVASETTSEPPADLAETGPESRARGESVRARLLELRREQSEREGQVAQLDAELREAEERWKQLRERLVGIWIEAPRLHRAGLTKAGLLLPESLPARREALTPALTQLEAVEATLESEATELERALAMVRAAERRALEAKAEASRRAGPAQLAQAESERLSAERIRAERRSADAAVAHERAESKLRRRLEAWPEGPERVNRDPFALRSEVVGLLDEGRARDAETAVRGARLESLRAAAPGAEARKQEAEAARQRAERARKDLAAELASARSERAQLLEGQACALVEAELREARERARQALEQAREASRQAEAAREAAAGELRSRSSRSELTLQAKHQREHELQAALSRFPPEERRAVEAEARAEIEDPLRLREERDALMTARAEAESRREDRLRRWQSHMETPPALDPETATELEARLRTEVDELRERLARTRAALEADQEAQARRAALAPELAGQTASLSRWSELSAVIGSADGKKLRSFAQSLTLEALVEQANFHLSALRPRYALRRLPRVDMELEIVDRDMGEERRGLGSLSGGETFLVSLALALGLSDLSARSVRIESLFIDEGFGALDGESLDTALAALDQLQASGRTVGLVSHVGEVAERIGYEVRVRPVSPGRAEVNVKAP